MEVAFTPTQCLIRIHMRTSFAKRTILFQGPKIWNNLPRNITIISSIAIFNELLNMIFLHTIKPNHNKLKNSPFLILLNSLYLYLFHYLYCLHFFSCLLLIIFLSQCKIALFELYVCTLSIVLFLLSLVFVLSVNIYCLSLMYSEIIVSQWKDHYYYYYVFFLTIACPFITLSF